MASVRGLPHKKPCFSPLLTQIPASKFSIDTGAGVIDADYRGILYVLLFNLGEKDFEGSYHFLHPQLRPVHPFFSPSVNEGDRIAQLIIERIYTPEISVVDVSLFSLHALRSSVTICRTWRRRYVVVLGSVRPVGIRVSSVAETKFGIILD